MRVCARVRERVRECVRVCICNCACLFAYLSANACVRACALACARACMFQFVCLCGRLFVRVLFGVTSAVFRVIGVLFVRPAGAPKSTARRPIGRRAPESHKWVCTHDGAKSGSCKARSVLDITQLWTTGRGAEIDRPPANRQRRPGVPKMGVHTIERKVAPAKQNLFLKSHGSGRPAGVSKLTARRPLQAPYGCAGSYSFSYSF